jgi:hypothetical protein
MMAAPGLRVSASSMGRAGAAPARNRDTLARLQALDKNGGAFREFCRSRLSRTDTGGGPDALVILIDGSSLSAQCPLPTDGQLDLDEVCDAIDEIIRKEKTERTLKWLLAALALFSLLTIAATVGLTYAVVVMSQDTQVDGSVLQSKDTGEALRTGSFLQSQNASALLSSVAASKDTGAALASISAIKVSSLKEGEEYTVYKVESVTVLTNNSVLVRTAAGSDFLIHMDTIVPDTSDVNATAQVGGRKLRGSHTSDVWVVRND